MLVTNNKIAFWEMFEKHHAEKRGRPMPTKTTIPIWVNGRIKGKQTIYFSNHPGTKRLTIQQTFR